MFVAPKPINKKKKISFQNLQSPNHITIPDISKLRSKSGRPKKGDESSFQQTVLMVFLLSWFSSPWEKTEDPMRCPEPAHVKRSIH